MTVLVVFLVKAFHCLLLRSGLLGAFFVVMRSEVGLGELRAFWRGSPAGLINDGDKTGVESSLRHVDCNGRGSKL